MENTQDLINFLFDSQKKQAEIAATSADNIFNADHRNKMLRDHNGTMAQVVKIEDLI